MPQIVLASQSTSRRRLLEGAGISPLVKVSQVDEETDFFVMTLNNGIFEGIQKWIFINRQRARMAPIDS